VLVAAVVAWWEALVGRWSSALQVRGWCPLPTKASHHPATAATNTRPAGNLPNLFPALLATWGLEKRASFNGSKERK